MWDCGRGRMWGGCGKDVGRDRKQERKERGRGTNTYPKFAVDDVQIFLLAFLRSANTYIHSNAPINVMPHYPAYGQMAGNIGALTEGGCPYSRAFDYL